MDAMGWLYLKEQFAWLMAVAKPEQSHFNTEGLNTLLNPGASNPFDAGNLTVSFEWDEERQLRIPTLVPQTLYQAFVVMLWLDVSTRNKRLRRCENPQCCSYFVAEKANKKFCDNTCALRVTQRRYQAQKRAARHKRELRSKAAH